MTFGLARGENDLLFCKVDWHSATAYQKNLMLEEIRSFHSDRLLNTVTDDLVSYLAEKYSINIPALDKEGITADQQEVKIDVSHDPFRMIRDRSRPYYIDGTRVEVEVPFSGDEAVFKIQPTTFSMNPPSAKFRQNTLIISMQGINLDSQKVRNGIDRTLADIDTHLERLRQSAEPFNQSLHQIARDQIEQRKAKLLRDRNLVANLGFPMKQREGVERTYTAPEVKRKVTSVPPKVGTAPYQPEPILEEKEYQHILSIMEQMVKVMECSPEAFCHSGEEALRTHFLVQLNGQYEGRATGETFNYEGKTDILIKSQGRNIFIAECKIWKGAKKHEETIGQLLGYLSWRDTKAAIIVFNRNKNFSAVLQEIEQTTLEHENCKRLIRKNSETSWTYLFSHRDDPKREMTVTVLAFDVPTPTEKDSSVSVRQL